MTGSHSRLAAAIDAFEADADRLAFAQAQAVLAHFGSYRLGNVPEAALIDSGRHNVRQVVGILRSGRPPDRADLDEARRTRERVNQGVPAEELHDAYRLCLRILGDAFVSTAGAVRLGQAEILAATRLLWESADILTSVVVVARQAAEQDITRHDKGKRLEFLRALLSGSSGPLAIRKQAASFGLASDRSYYAIRARALAPSQRAELQSRLEVITRTYGCPPLLGMVDGDIAGVVPLKPALSDARFTVGIGGPLALDSMPRAFAAASRMLDVALGFGWTGSFELRDLSLHVAVAAEPELGALLVDRYLVPLHHEGEFGAELEQTIRTHLECGARIQETAKRLALHPNSVRHRLARFEDLTGARLDELRVQTEVWWALTWLEHEAERKAGADSP